MQSSIGTTCYQFLVKARDVSKEQRGRMWTYLGDTTASRDRELAVKLASIPMLDTLRSGSMEQTHAQQFAMLGFLAESERLRNTVLDSLWLSTRDKLQTQRLATVILLIWPQTALVCLKNAQSLESRYTPSSGLDPNEYLRNRTFRGLAQLMQSIFVFLETGFMPLVDINHGAKRDMRLALAKGRFDNLNNIPRNRLVPSVRGPRRNISTDSESRPMDQSPQR
jgi:hypothetical protein